MLTGAGIVEICEGKRKMIMSDNVILMVICLQISVESRPFWEPIISFVVIVA